VCIPGRGVRSQGDPGRERASDATPEMPVFCRKSNVRSCTNRQPHYVARHQIAVSPSLETEIRDPNVRRRRFQLSVRDPHNDRIPGTESSREAQQPTSRSGGSCPGCRIRTAIRTEYAHARKANAGCPALGVAYTCMNSMSML